MKRHLCLALALAFGPALVTTAQEGPGRREGQPGAGRPNAGQPGAGRPERQPGEGRGPMGREGGPGRFLARLPIMLALNANQDGEVSAEEINGATEALKKLDKNADGKLSMDELMPSFEGMGPGPGGFGGGFPGGGFGGGFGGEGVPSPEDMAQRLMAMDKDNDGYLVESELPDRLKPMFARADANSDQKLSKEEVTTMAQRQGGRPGLGGPDGGRDGREGGGREGRRGQRPASE